jgi:hypothetical protein
VQGIVKVTIHGVKEEPIQVEGVDQENVSWKEGTKTLMVEGLQLSVDGDSTLSWE